MKILSAIAAIMFLLLAIACTKPSGFDPTANPDQALDHAVREAQTSGKKVLVIAGGDWCNWSRALESLISSDTDIKNALDQNFVTIKVYFGEKNQNTAFFSKLTPTNVHPYFWVISKDGDVVKSVDPSSVEDGSNSYNKTKFLQLVLAMKND
ncbi:MAG: Thiol-disulfide isomerase/thioredoxin domain protein [Proteobacteria bacterium]|nr:Thiol-disulfide isomerase/thioredoxin domain protein [Pseudomonadota bacterium]